MDQNSMHHGMGEMSPPPMNGTGMNDMHQKMMMHMTFFWGKNAAILFSGWPGTSTGMYVLALILVFGLSVLVEWLSHSRLLKSSTNNVAAGLVQTAMHTIRVGLAYMLMLALMSFNGGVFLVAVAGHSIGFLLFGSRIFRKSEIPPYEKHSDLPPMSC
ncbi:hypothetical protein HHK36_011103 [Tetracentron sinense]|uniref:Copper transport protein n=1 Tax=Tetracentron sinense TaxID=13715 RepID=A0A835DFW6_TETSI|nr:hypothetical protein HHK36_011103 [Tetracentron sinense]